MPPRKKARASVLNGSTTTTAAHKDSISLVNPHPENFKYDILKDPWTDEQETSLFKGIIKWKPAGIHKHFRMIAISEHLRNHGYDPRVEKHTRIPGIWEKIKTLYNIDAINYNENNLDYDPPDLKSGEKADIYIEFKLPEEFDEALFMRGKRNANDMLSDAPSSPPRLGRSPSPPIMRKRKRADTNNTRRASTVEDTDDTRSSPAHSLPSKTIRRRRPLARAKRTREESSSRAPSTTMDEDEGTEDVEEDVEEAGSIPSSKGKAAKVKTETPAIRKSKRKK